MPTEIDSGSNEPSKGDDENEDVVTDPVAPADAVAQAETDDAAAKKPAAEESVPAPGDDAKKEGAQYSVITDHAEDAKNKAGADAASGTDDAFKTAAADSKTEPPEERVADTADAKKEGLQGTDRKPDADTDVTAADAETTDVAKATGASEEDPPDTSKMGEKSDSKADDVDAAKMEGLQSKSEVAVQQEDKAEEVTSQQQEEMKGDTPPSTEPTAPVSMKDEPKSKEEPPAIASDATVETSSDQAEKSLNQSLKPSNKKEPVMAHRPPPKVKAEPHHPSSDDAPMGKSSSSSPKHEAPPPVETTAPVVSAPLIRPKQEPGEDSDRPTTSPDSKAMLFGNPDDPQAPLSSSQDADHLARTWSETIFPMKLYDILCNPDFHHAIAWMPHGRSWKVLNKDFFMEEICPQYFAQTRYESFIRQVNGWGFKRMRREGPDRSSYYHEHFLRGYPNMIDHMRRPAPGEKSRDLREEPDFYSVPAMPQLPPADPNRTSNLPNKNYQIKKVGRPAGSSSSGNRGGGMLTHQGSGGGGGQMHGSFDAVTPRNMPEGMPGPGSGGGQQEGFYMPYHGGIPPMSPYHGGGQPHPSQQGGWPPQAPYSGYPPMYPGYPPPMGPPPPGGYYGPPPGQQPHGPPGSPWRPGPQGGGWAPTGPQVGPPGQAPGPGSGPPGTPQGSRSGHSGGGQGGGQGQQGPPPMGTMHGGPGAGMPGGGPPPGYGYPPMYGDPSQYYPQQHQMPTPQGGGGPPGTPQRMRTPTTPSRSGMKREPENDDRHGSASKRQMHQGPPMPGPQMPGMPPGFYQYPGGPPMMAAPDPNHPSMMHPPGGMGMGMGMHGEMPMQQQQGGGGPPGGAPGPPPPGLDPQTGVPSQGMGPGGPPFSPGMMRPSPGGGAPPQGGYPGPHGHYG